MKILVCQPDNDYFIWQLKAQMINLSKYDKERDCVILLGYYQKPNPNALGFARKAKAKVIFIEDTRPRPLVYHPNIVPYLMNRYFTHYKNDAAPFLYIGDDVLLAGKEMVLPNEGKVYLTKTDSYISSKYIKRRSEDIFYRMCNICQVDPEIVEANDSNCGGAQHLFNVVPPVSFWQKWYEDSEKIYLLLREYNKQFPKEKEDLKTPKRIQEWTAGMWALLYNLWVLNICTETSPVLSHSWPSTPINKLGSHCFYHNAGVEEDRKDRNKFFYKGAFRKRSPIASDIVNQDQTKASYWYAKQVIEGIDSFNSR